MGFESKVEEAVACFNGGCNCSQAVFTTYCEEFGLDKAMGLKIASGLGGGMGRLQETCGAVSGAYLLIGMKHGQYAHLDKEAKDKTYGLVREFAKRFKSRNKVTSCREILGFDLMDSSFPNAHDKVKGTCPKMVRDAAEIVEEMLFSDN
ncbi:MAG: C-GCAxxG-C-C family protein [Clostridiales bacterium]|nr:C-GCAxxG-C-C family protein [Clostridiales bacterium]